MQYQSFALKQQLYIPPFDALLDICDPDKSKGEEANATDEKFVYFY